jgi:pyridine nucleotide-disulfide oxidoreductase family protein
VKRVLLVGGGHAHAWVLREGIPGEVTLVTPYPHHTYSGMLPGYVAGHYAAGEIRIDVAAVCERAGARLVLGRVAALDAANRRARLENGQAIDYDTASLDVGSEAAAPAFALAAKPFEPFMARWEEVRGALRRVVVVGGGAAGVEMAMAIAHRSGAGVTLYSDRPMFQAGLARRLARQLEACGVALRAAAYARDDAGAPPDLVVWTAGASALPWLRESGLAVDERGFVLVDDRLRSVSHPEVYAVGDCATLRDAPHPKSGVYAVRHARVLCANLRGADVPYAPQRRALAILSCGRRYAVAAWGPLAWEGEWVWRWKDRIDRRWVQGFRP